MKEGAAFQQRRSEGDRETAASGGVEQVQTLTNGFNLTIRVDILHLDRFGHVLRALPELPPWRFGPLVWHGAQVIELPAGTIARTGTEVGDRLAFETGSVSASHSDQAQAPAAATETLP